MTPHEKVLQDHQYSDFDPVTALMIGKKVFGAMNNRQQAPPPPPVTPQKSNTGLWIALGGVGLIVIVLVIVMAMKQSG